MTGSERDTRLHAGDERKDLHVVGADEEHDVEVALHKGMEEHPAVLSRIHHAQLPDLAPQRRVDVVLPRRRKHADHLREARRR
eukprot:3273286-Rhodomonas_salina.7